MKNQSEERTSPRRVMRVLIVEDSAPDAELMVAMLKRAGYPLTFETVSESADFQLALSGRDYDLVLCDHNLRTWSGLMALEILRKMCKDTPFVVVTATLGDEAAVEYIKQGAADYVLKHRLERLPVAVGQALRDKAHREEATRLNEQILAGKREWELTFDNVPAPVMLLNFQGEIVRANQALTELTEKKFSEVIGRLCWDVLPCEHNGGLNCPHDRTLATGQFTRREELVSLKDRLLECTGSPLRDPGGKLTGTVIVLHDVTERLRAEDAMRQSEERFRTAFRGSPEPITISRLSDSRYVDVNDAFLRAVGYEREEVVDHPAEELRLWVDAGLRDRIKVGLRAGGEVHDREIQIRTKTGEMRWHMLSGELIELAGEPCMIFMARDITERKLAESQLAEQLEELRRWHKVTLDREERIMALKREINELLRGTGKSPRYSSVEPEEVSGRE